MRRRAAKRGFQELTDGHGEVGYGKAHVVHSILMYPEDIAVGIGRVVERRDQVLQRVACLYFPSQTSRQHSCPF